MENTRFYQRIGDLRRQVDDMKGELDGVIDQLQEMGEQGERIATEARGLVDNFGPRGEGGGFPFFFVLIALLGLGAGALWMFAPDTFDQVKQTVTEQYKMFAGQSNNE